MLHPCLLLPPHFFPEHVSPTRWTTDSQVAHLDPITRHPAGIDRPLSPALPTAIPNALPYTENTSQLPPRIAPLHEQVPDNSNQQQDPQHNRDNNRDQIRPGTTTATLTTTGLRGQHPHQRSQCPVLYAAIGGGGDDIELSADTARVGGGGVEYGVRNDPLVGTGRGAQRVGREAHVGERRRVVARGRAKVGLYLHKRAGVAEEGRVPADFFCRVSLQNSDAGVEKMRRRLGGLWQKDN
ncbi:hypothetical protein TruAng_008602 [Truncatella angustata]|nr:hypothetical protein TruAng_008602 [Truncatella angustata]